MAPVLSPDTPPPLPRSHSVLATLIASAAAGVSSTVVGFPFDNIKARMQTHYFPSMTNCFRETIQREGFRGLFRGIGPPLVTISITKVQAQMDGLGLTSRLFVKDPNDVLGLGKIRWEMQHFLEIVEEMEFFLMQFGRVNDCLFGVWQGV